MKIKWTDINYRKRTGITVFFTNSPEGTKAIVLEDANCRLWELLLKDFEVVCPE